MARDRLESEYFEWIYSMLFGGDTDVAKPATELPTGGRRPKAGGDTDVAKPATELPTGGRRPKAGGDTDVAKPATELPTGGRRPKAGGDRAYTELLAALHSIPFRYTIPMDGNREADGINLRYRFGYECEYEDYVIAQYLDISPCSVLEMMTALAIRCEEIMERADNANHTGEWFCGMLESLGLMEMNNARIDISAVHEAVRQFLDRDYAQDGNGGLFTVSRKCDMRTIEIWYQMQYWLDEQLRA